MEVQRKLASLDVILWLRENYKVGKNGSVSKNSVYQHYFDSCQEKGIEPVISATYFGKLVKRAFPGIKYNRKGPRGSAVQHYTCLKRAKIGVDVGLAGASPYPEYGTPGGGAVIAGGAFTAEELALCQYSLKRERLEHADPDSPSLDHPPGTFSPRRRQAMFPHPFAHGYPPPPSSSSSHHHYHHPPPPHPHAQHYPHHQPPQHFATEAPAHAYHHRAPPSSHARDAGLRSPTGDELSAPWTLERDHSAPPPVAMMRGSHAPPTAPAYQAQHRHQHAAVTNARSRASPHPYDLVERHHHHHQQQQQQPHLSPDPGDHPHPHTRHEYPAHHSSHYGHPAAHLRSPSLQLGYPAHDHDNDHERDHHHQQQQHHHHHQQHHQHHPYYHHQHLQQRSSAPLLPSPRGHASSSGASPHPHAGYRFQAMVRGHASHASANSSPTSPSGSSHIGSSNPPSPPSPPPHLLLPSLDSATFATPLLPSSTATATASGGASIGGLRNSPTATDHHHHQQQQHNNSNSNNRHNVAAAASTTPNADETRHDQRQQVPAATSSSSELATPASSSSSVPHAFEPSMEDMYPLPTFTSEDLERHQPQPQPQQHSHQQQQSLRPPLGRSSSPALEHLLRGIASRDVEDEELVSFYDHYLKA